MLRKLSGMEREMLMTSGIGPIQFSTAARVRGDFLPEQLQAAFSKIRQRHPLLAVRLARDVEGQIWFTQEDVPGFPLRVVKDAQEDEWVPVLAKELARSFVRESGPLVRFIWLRGDGWSDLIAISHHAVSDGLAAAYLMRDLLRHLGNPDAPVEPLPLLPPATQMIPPEVDAVLSKMSIPDLLELSSFMARDKKPGRASKYAMRLVFALLKSPVGPLIVRLMNRPATRRAEHAPDTPAPAAPITFCLSAWSLDQVKTAALVACARQEGTTVHAVLGAAFLIAFAEVIGAGWWRRMIQSPVGLRDRLHPPVGEDFGLFMTLVKATVNCSPERDFWDVARDLKARLDREMTPERLFAMHGLIKAFSALPDGAMSRTGDVEEAFRDLEYDLSLSNIGRLDFPVMYGPLRLESLYGPTFSAMPGDRIVGVNTVGGRMHFTFIFRDTTLDNSTGKRIKDLTMQHLGEAVGW